MPVTINWITKIITVEKADLQEIQLIPTEIYRMDLDWFRYQLKALEASEEGMTFLDTHNHNTEVTLGGLTFARVIEIINGYTVTFEDGQYAVNLTGANSNVGDVVNVNQVSVRSQNSAGLISTPLIETASFEGGVTIDETNITGRAIAGTLHPAGTPLAPSSNLADTKLIDEVRGFSRIYVIGPLDVTGAYDFSRYTFQGRSHVNNTVTIFADVNVTNVVFRELKVTGILDGGNEISNSIIEDLIYVNGHIHRCGLIGDIKLDGNLNAAIMDCSTLDPFNPPAIDMGGSGQSLSMPNYSGLLTIYNMNGPGDFCGIGLSAGQVILADTVTAGMVHISGVGAVLDELGNHIVSQPAWNGGVTVINETVSATSFSYEDWDTIWIDTENGETGTTFPTGKRRHPVKTAADAKVIAEANGIFLIHIHGDLVLTEDWEGYAFASHSPDLGSVDLNVKSVDGTSFTNLTMLGRDTGHLNAKGCNFPNGYSENMDCNLENCIMTGTFKAAAGATLNFDRCSFPANTIIDLNGTGSLNSANMSGVMTVTNMTDAASTIGLTGIYLLTLHSTCTAGTVLVAGIGIHNDLSGSGCNVTDRTVPGSTWEELTSVHEVTGTMGERVNLIKKILFNRLELAAGSTNNWILYDDDKVTPISTWDMSDSTGAAITMDAGIPAKRIPA